MTAPLTVAIVGTNIGSTLHARALRAAGFAVIGIAGRDAAKTARRAAELGIRHAYASAEAAIDGEADAVVIATPPAQHHPLVLRAVAAGKHVLCEKPFALTVAQAEEMRDAAAARGVVGQVVHQLRWFAAPSAARGWIAEGALGRPLHGAFLFDHVPAARGLATMPEWWPHAERGGGWLPNYASHGIDLVRYLLGDFESVSATLHDDPARGMTADDGYALAFRLRNGLHGVMSGTCRARDACDLSRIVGERATIRLDGRRAELVDDDGRRTAGAAAAAGTAEGAILVHDPEHGVAEQARLAASFRDRILDPGYRHPSVATFADGVAHMRVIAAAVEAARTGRWVTLD